MAIAAPQRMTLAEFLSWDDGTPTHYELVRRHLVAMAPPAERHGTIVSNLIVRIGGSLAPPRRVVTQAGVTVPGRDDTWYEADLAVTCAPPDPERQHVVDPILIVEVLLPSTEQHDRGTKLPDYRSLPSVREILLVSSRERRVELLRRESGRWIIDDLISDAELRLNAIEGTVRLAAIYASTAV